MLMRATGVDLARHKVMLKESATGTSSILARSSSSVVLICKVAAALHSPAILCACSAVTVLHLAVQSLQFTSQCSCYTLTCSAISACMHEEKHRYSVTHVFFQLAICSLATSVILPSGKKTAHLPEHCNQMRQPFELLLLRYLK